MAEETMNDFKDEIDRSFRKVKEGDILEGTVIDVSDTEIILDLKYYTQGIIRVADMSDDPKFSVHRDVKVCDEVSATVISTDDGNGNIISEETELGGLLDNNRDGYYDYAKNGSNGKIQEVIYGDVNDRSLISYKDPEIPGYEDEELEKAQRFIGNSFTGKHKKGAYTFDEEASSLKHLEFKEEGALSVEEIGSQLKIPCYGGQPREIVLSIYLEGWDLDCINATMGASFNTRLSFKL